jgi:Dynein light intermediate chain (DLIC)
VSIGEFPINYIRPQVANSHYMDRDSRSSSPEPPPQDLWSSILNSVSSSRSIPEKNILILGQPLTGKTTLASALLQKQPSDPGKDDPPTDFSLGYDWADIRDDGEEGLSFFNSFRVFTNPTTRPAPAQISLHACPSIPYHPPLLHIPLSFHNSCTHIPLFLTRPL